MEQQPTSSGKARQVVDTILLKPTVSREPSNYEPSEHRHPERPTNYFETLLHLVKASCGTGILAMPHAFSKSGYKTGIIGTILIGFLCTYCIRTLVAVQYELSKRLMKPSLTYMETAAGCIGEGPQCCRNFTLLPKVSNILVIIFQLGCACIYLIFVAKNMKQVCENYMETDIPEVIYLTATVMILFLTALINDFKILAILSFFANVSTLTAFAILAVYIVRGSPTFVGRTDIGEIKHLPLFMGTVIFSMEAIGSVIPLENEMAKPLDFTSALGVIHVAMVPTVALYVAIGLFGYLNYGDDIKGSVTLNLPTDEFLANLCRILMVFGIFSTMVLALFIMFDIIWKSYIEVDEQRLNIGKIKRYLFQYCLRICLTLLAFVISVIIPNLELLISLIGSFCLATTGVMFPALFNLLTYWYDYKGGSFVWFFIWCSIIMIIGVLTFFIGVYTSLYSIYEELFAR